MLRYLLIIKKKKEEERRNMAMGGRANDQKTITSWKTAFLLPCGSPNASNEQEAIH
jgi:hypothetical protein